MAIGFCVLYIAAEDESRGRWPIVNWSQRTRDPSTRFGILSLHNRIAQLAISLCLRCMQFIRLYEPWPLRPGEVHNGAKGELAETRVASLTFRALTTFDHYRPARAGVRRRADELPAIASPGSSRVNPFPPCPYAGVPLRPSRSNAPLCLSIGPFYDSFGSRVLLPPALTSSRQTLPRRLCMSFAARTGMRSGMVALSVLTGKYLSRHTPPPSTTAASVSASVSSTHPSSSANPLRPPSSRRRVAFSRPSTPKRTLQICR